MRSSHASPGVTAGRPEPAAGVRAPATGGGGIFEQPLYLEAQAAHEGSEIWHAGQGAVLPLLRSRDGSFHTAYGYPAPCGDVDEGLDELGDMLLTAEARLHLSLSPLGAGAALARRLAERSVPVGERPICVCALDGDPLLDFSAGARKMIDRARRGGAVASVGSLQPSFPGLYREAMRALGADPVYLFGDAYFARLARLGALQVTVRDALGVAAVGLFLCRGGEAAYHLSARRASAPPIPGAANLVVLEGMRAARRLGARVCILGGGRSPAPDDPLFVFKRGMATDVLPRPTFEVAP